MSDELYIDPPMPMQPMMGGGSNVGMALQQFARAPLSQQVTGEIEVLEARLRDLKSLQEELSKEPGVERILNLASRLNLR